MTAEKVLHGLRDGEFQIHFAAVAQYHDKETQPSAGGTHIHRTVFVYGLLPFCKQNF
jgi:hypothetical protein